MATRSPASFPFLDLPKDLRLTVYDQLITRTHHDITARINGQDVTVTIVQTSPTPPIHLACKVLYAEAALFLEAKIDRMGMRHMIPRLFVHAGPLAPLFHDPEVLPKFINTIQDCRNGIVVEATTLRQTVAEYKNGFAQPPSDYSLGGLAAFLNTSGNYLKKIDPSMKSWVIDACFSLPGDADNTVLFEEEEDVIKLARNLMIGSDARSKELNIAIVSEQPKAGEFSMPEFLEHISESTELRIFVHTFGGEFEWVDFTDTRSIVCYVGAMDKKTWTEEWA